MSQPLVTVLMPVFNAQKFLREAIDSILAQTFTNFEFLIIDDASTDDSVSIINSYDDPRIRLVQNELNSGISATLNKGLQLASAALVARMDADDISHPERLEKQYNFLQAHPGCALLSTWARVVTEDKEHIRTEKYNKHYYYYNMTFSCWIYHPTVMYRRDAVLSVGAYRSLYAEDYDLFWQMLRNFRADHLEETLLDYRVTGQSLHQVTRKKEYDEAMSDQILRNMRFYAGDNFSLTDDEMQCLRFNFEPVLKSRNLSAIINAFRKLRRITNGVLATSNPNLDAQKVREAHYFRKRYMKSQLVSKLPPLHGLVVRLIAAVS